MEDIIKKIKSGELYDCSLNAIPDEVNNRILECKELIYDFNNSRPSELRLREGIIKKLFAEVGDNCYIEPPFYANWGCNMHVGKNFLCEF